MPRGPKGEKRPADDRVSMAHAQPPARRRSPLGEMRAAGVRGLLIYCSDYNCSHSTAISGDSWPDDVRLSDLEPPVHLPGLRRKGCRCPAGFRLAHEAARRAASYGNTRRVWPSPFGPRGTAEIGRKDDSWQKCC
jgi:hypothetical protein